MKKNETVYNKILSSTERDGNSIYFIAPKTVYEFFNSGVKRLIPDYQRPYSWEKKNIEDLLRDVKKLTESSGNESWFLGPIFSTKTTDYDQVSHLLDGQQRVTTIQIVLCEAALIKYYENGIDLSDDPDLSNATNRLLQAVKNTLHKIGNGGTVEPVFETESSIKDYFEEYILSIDVITSYEERVKFRKDFFKRLDKEKEDGSKTAGTIKAAINVINDFFVKEFFDKKHDPFENFKKFNLFISTLLWKCWLIEIPLKEDDESIQIFESINNRGKKLTLVDKLRYKALIQSDSKKVRDKVKLKWKIIYSGIDDLLEWKYIKEEDDFFKVFFNSVNGAGYVSEDRFIELYEQFFLIDDSKIELFLEEVEKVLFFYNTLDSCLDLRNPFISSFSNKEEGVKVRSLLHLLKYTLKISENSRVLLFNLIRSYDLHNDKYIVVQGIWAIIRLVFFVEVFTNSSSNITRSDYMRFVKEIMSGSYNFSNIIQKLTADGTIVFRDKPISFVIRPKNNDNDIAKFIIILFNYLHDYKAIVSGAPDQHKTSELEHLFPTAWKDHWSDKVYSKSQVIDHIDNLDEQDYPHLNLERLKNEILIFDDFELKPYDKKASRLPNSLLEFIGNKWVLNDTTNVKISNESFKVKKQEYQNSRYIIIPANDNSLIGVNKFNDFGYSQVIDRSLAICDGILAHYKNEWDDIS